MAEVAAAVRADARPGLRPRGAMVVHPYAIAGVCLTILAAGVASGSRSPFAAVAFGGLAAGWSSAWSP